MSNNHRQKQGYVYILINQSYLGLLKIGMTTRSPEERAKELSRPTGVATPFFVAYKQETSDCELVEKEIHTRLSDFRHRNNREFFELPLHEAVQMLPRIIESVERQLTIKGAMSILNSTYCHEDQKYFIENFILSASQYISDENLIHKLLIKLLKLYNNHLWELIFKRNRTMKYTINNIEDSELFSLAFALNPKEYSFIEISPRPYFIYPSDLEFPSVGAKVDEPTCIYLENSYPDDLYALEYDYEKNAELCLITKGIESLIPHIDKYNNHGDIVLMAIEEILEKGSKSNIVEFLEHIVDFLSEVYSLSDLILEELISQEDKTFLIFYQNPIIESSLSSIAQNNEDKEIKYLAFFCIYALYLLEWGFFNDEDEGVGYSHFCYKNDEKSFLDFITWNGSPEKTKAVAKYSTRFFYILSRFDKQSIDDIFRIIYLEKYERGADVDDQSLLNILNEMAHVNEYTGENDEEIGFHWCEDRETKKMIVDSLIKLRNHFDEETLTIYFKSLL